jgi:hypothetical protein
LNEGATLGENAEGSAAFDSMGAGLGGQYRPREASSTINIFTRDLMLSLRSIWREADVKKVGTSADTRKILRD